MKDERDLYQVEPMRFYPSDKLGAPSPPARKLEKKNGLTLAILPRLAGYAFLLFLAWLLFSTLFRPWMSDSATHAIIDARAILVTSPIDGTVSAIHTRDGDVIKPGQAVAVVKNDTVTRDTLTSLLTRRMKLKSQLDDVHNSIQSDTQMLAYIDKQYSRYHHAGVAQLQRVHASLRSQMDAASASAEAATDDYYRALRLKDDGAASAAQVDAAREKMTVAMSNADAAEQQARNVGSNLTAARDGVYMSGSGSDGMLPKLAQKRANLEAEVKNERLQAKTLKKQLADLNGLVGQEHQRVNTLSAYTIKADAAGTTQEIVAPVGTHVTAGATLVRATDCSKSGVVAVFDSHLASRLQKGSEIKVDMDNIGGPLRAHVVQLLPSISDQMQNGYSVPFPHADDSSVYALARWDTDTPPWLLKKACMPGVTVKASLM